MQEICTQYVFQFCRIVLVLQPVILQRNQRVAVTIAGTLSSAGAGNAQNTIVAAARKQ